MTATHDAEGATPDRNPDEIGDTINRVFARLHKAREVKQLAEQHADSLTRKVAWANQEEADLAALNQAREQLAKLKSEVAL